MKINIGIEEQDRKTIVDGLAKFLADSYTLYLKTQNFHWNVVGPQFQELHELFETQYRDLFEAIDEIAERIRALGFPAPGGFTIYSKLTTIKDVDGVPTAKEMIKTLVIDNETLVHTARSVFPLAEKASDQPTADLLSDRMKVHEKAAWMLRSLLE